MSDNLKEKIKELQKELYIYDKALDEACLLLAQGGNPLIEDEKIILPTRRYFKEVVLRKVRGKFETYLNYDINK